MEKTNVIFGASIFMSMKGSNLLNKNIIEFFSVFEGAFTFMDLSNIDNYEVEVPKELYSKMNYSFKDKIDKLNEAVNNNEDIRIWTSHLDVNSYLFFLYLCDYLKDKECNLYVVYSDEYNKYSYSPACLKSNELEELAKLEHKLSKEEIDKFSKEWIRIKNSKADMRILENKEVKLVSFNYFNDTILDLLKQLGEVKVSKLVALFMKDYCLDAFVVAYLINRLIESYKIKVVSIGERFFENDIVINEL